MSCKPTYKGIRYNSLEELRNSVKPGLSPKADIQGFKEFITNKKESTNQSNTQQNSFQQDRPILTTFVDLNQTC